MDLFKPIVAADRLHHNFLATIKPNASGVREILSGWADGFVDRDGKFVTAWGRKCAAAGEFDTPHALAMDSTGRLFVADRANDRIQIFDQDGKFLAEWKQFGRPSGLFIDQNDILYAADSQSGAKFNAPFQQGIRIGSVKDGKVTAFIADSNPVPNMPEGVAADREGNVYGGFTDKRTVKKFVPNDRRAER